MEHDQPVFLLKISGNVTGKLKNDQAVLAVSWEYSQKQTSVFVKADRLDADESIRAGRGIKKHFSIYGIVRSVHYCKQGLTGALRVDLSKVRRKCSSRLTHSIEATVANV